MKESIRCRKISDLQVPSVFPVIPLHLFGLVLRVIPLSSFASLKLFLFPIYHQLIRLEIFWSSLGLFVHFISIPFSFLILGFHLLNLGLGNIGS